MTYDHNSTRVLASAGTLYAGGEMLRDHKTTPRQAWINTIVVLTIFVVALAIALIIRF